MNKKIRLDTAIFLLVAVALLTAVLTYSVLNNMVNGVTESMSIFSKLKKVNDIVDEKYIGEINNEALLDDTVRGYVAGLDDPYAQYFTKEEYREYKNSFAGNFQGIGVRIINDTEAKGLYITYVMKDSPAHKAGIKIGDIIIKAAGAKVSEIGATEAYNRLLGEINTIANFTVLRDGKEIDFEIKREAFTEHSLESKMHNGIGYIRIFSFAENTPQEFDEAVTELISKDAGALIFDVRDNPGGGLNSVVGVLDRLLPKDKLVTTLRYNSNNIKGTNIVTVKTKDNKEVDMPFVVLVNNESASAAELFTATLKDYNLAKIIGETTFGKGVGQETFELPDQSHVKLTAFTYVPPSGVSYNNIGIQPDIEVEFPESLEKRRYVLTVQEDPQMKEAVLALGGTVEIIEAPPESEEVVD